MEDNGIQEKPNRLRKALLSEITTLIPFACLTNVNKYWDNGQKSFDDLNTFQRANWLRRCIFNAGLSVFGIFYFAGSIFYGANPLNPREYLQKTKQEIVLRGALEEQKMRGWAEERFYKVDKNRDLVLDVNEFCDYYLGRRE